MSLPMFPRTRLWRRGRGRFPSDHGVALVEFALVLPFLLLVAFGMVDLGKAVSYWNDETHLANQAARYAAVNNCDACAPGQMINDYVANQAESEQLRNALTGQGGVGSLTIEFPETAVGGGPAPQNHCAGHSVKVIVSYRYPVMPFLSGIFGNGGTINITASSTMRLERDWVGDGSDKYDPAPGSASLDQCPTS
jgi:Flp pilus assembly protein TadG